MIKESFKINKTSCSAYCCDGPICLLIQPVDDNDLRTLDSEAEYLQGIRPFILVSFKVGSWFKDLSPWKAPAVFGKEDFGDGAKETLCFITEELLPNVRKRYSLPENIPVILGGYSLAAFFALWCAYQTDVFSAVAAASPSVWFPGWLDYAKARAPLAGRIYLSLGDKEEKTKNKLMATVGDCLRKQCELIKDSSTDCILEWNQGNHFKEPDLRTAKGFTWCMKAI